MPSPTVVIGGGIVGLSAAYYLARRGAAVTLLDDGHAGDSASTGNAGLIALGHPPLPRPGLALKSLRWMFDSGSPLYIRPRLDAGLVRWLWRFHRSCRADHFRRSMEILCAHGRPAGACFRELIEEEGIDCEYAPVGQLEVFRTEAGRERVAREAEMMRGYGYEVDVLDGAALRDREPAFRDDVRGAAHYKESAFANPGAFVAALATRAAAHGATLHLDRVVAGLVVEHGRCRGVRTADGERLDADTVVLAAGIWSSAMAREVGLRIPMQPAKGYHVELDVAGRCPRTAAVLAEVFVAVTPMSGGLRLAGTLELSGINHRIVRKRVDRLSAGARIYIDGLEEARIRSTWCGLRPCTADGLPVVGWAPGIAGLFVATGHAMMGFTLGPLAGRVAAECILGDKPSVDLSPLRVDRPTLA